MIGLYFSGTGNTKHCVEEFVRCFDSEKQSFSIDNVELNRLLDSEETIVFGYPIYFSNLPKKVRDFILNHTELFREKKIFVIATMGLFSGDGAGCSARIFRKCGAEIIGGLHLKMPDCIGDSRLLKKTLQENRLLIKQADNKIHLAVERLKVGKPFKEGLNIFYHIADYLDNGFGFMDKRVLIRKSLILI